MALPKAPGCGGTGSADNCQSLVGLYFDDLGPLVGQDTGGGWPSMYPGEVQHPDPLKRMPGG